MAEVQGDGCFLLLVDDTAEARANASIFACGDAQS